METNNLKFKDKLTILVDLFIKKELAANWQSNDWGRERMGGKRLMTKYSDFDFFYSLEDLYGKFNSLLGISDKYVKGLSRRYEDYVIDKSRRVSYPLSEVPLVTIEEPIKKAKNMIDFLDN